MNSFVYCWTDHRTKKLYIGSHKGSVDDKYVCSSKPMLKEYKCRPLDFTRTIIAQGAEEDIRKLETKLLIAFDAAADDQFYNLHNYAQPQKSGWSHGPEARKKISENNKGRKVSAATRKLISESNKGRHSDSEETRKKKSLAQKGNQNTKGMLQYHNGDKRILLRPDESVPEGFIRGTGKYFGRPKGMMHYHNKEGKRIMLKPGEPIPEGFLRGAGKHYYYGKKKETSNVN